MLRHLKSRLCGVLSFFLLVISTAPLASAQATYYTNSDNENNANTHVADNDMDVSLGRASGIHPIEFNIMVTTLPQSSAVLSQVLRQGAVMTVAGLMLGLAGAAMFGRYLEGILFGLEPLDPPTFVGVAVLFAVVAALACYVPARRATRVDPLVALRTE